MALIKCPHCGKLLEVLAQANHDVQIVVNKVMLEEKKTAEPKP